MNDSKGHSIERIKESVCLNQQNIVQMNAGMKTKPILKLLLSIDVFI